MRALRGCFFVLQKKKRERDNIYSDSVLYYIMLYIIRGAVAVVGPWYELKVVDSATAVYHQSVLILR